MVQTGSDPRLRELRKYESILVLSGFGVIAFGLWSIIRAAIYYILNPFDVESFIGKSEYAQMLAEGREQGVEFITENLGTIIMVFLFTVLVIELLLRVYVGMSARAYGRGLKKRSLFIVLSWIMAILSLADIIMVIVEFLIPVIEVIRDSSGNAYAETGSNGDQAATVSMFVEFTSMLVLIELAVSGGKVRKLRKELGIKTRKATADDYYDDMVDMRGTINSIAGDITGELK